MDTIYNLEKNLQSSQLFHSFFQALMYIDKNDSFPKEFSPLSWDPKGQSGISQLAKECFCLTRHRKETVTWGILHAAQELSLVHQHEVHFLCKR